MKINPYLNFHGQCEEAIKFYAKVLGGKIEAMMPFEGTPAESHVPAAARKQIMHACLTVGDLMLMASDAPGDQFEPMQGMSVALHVDKIEEAERIFRELSQGGNVRMPLQETFWAKRFGMFVDRFGTPWMINCAPAA